MNRPRILFIDAYDSFSNNIVSLLTTVLDADVDILPIDPPHLDPRRPGFKQELSGELRRYDAVVCGPGPGSPNSERDVGLMKYIWELEAKDLVPVLGICLGFQSLVVSCGGLVKKLRTGLHGMIRAIDHSNGGPPSLQEGNIFSGVPPFKATLYHSLHADIGQESIPAADWPNFRWNTPTHLPNIMPLAWTYEDRGDSVERILMGVKHREKPFWGLQYHPESICTESVGHGVIENWFHEAMRWNHAAGRKTETAPAQPTGATKLRRLSTRETEENAKLCGYNLDNFQSWIGGGSQLASFGLKTQYLYRSIDIPLHIEVPDIVEILQANQHEYIVLDSASAKASRIGSDVRGRYSIIALDVDEVLKLEYRTGDKHATARRSRDPGLFQGTPETIKLGPHQTIWHFLAEFWTRRHITNDDNPSSPFLGGFMGYTTYELGLEGINVALHEERRHNRPDLCFAWVTKSIVVDHMEGTLHIQQLSESESAGQLWLDSIAEKLSSSSIWADGLRVDFQKHRTIANSHQQHHEPTPPRTPTSGTVKTQIRVPDAEEYEVKVRLCQDYIAKGDSYELCLTDQTLITVPKPQCPRDAGPSLPTAATASSNNKTDSEHDPYPSSSWDLYLALRTRQPAPFGSYVRLGAATLISSSPERFLEYSPSPSPPSSSSSSSGGEGTTRCSMRPMKGTVRKSAAVPTLARAEQILHVPKEEAENLMIVDLVRHDLHGVCGPARVGVPRLLVVEEYASVFQMISVVEGTLPPSPPSGSKEGEGGGGGAGIGGARKFTGLDVLAASLPPGSMTGAPKKRSCEILLGVERPERSLYSGVVGYMDVRGRGDWSVTIRSLFRWDDEVPVRVQETGGGGGGKEPEMELWHIGAGGAVTALSTAEGERDEMFVKLKGPLGVFEEQA
ncbi:ADC synthase [Biscogniauxia marginata]|nr:ADC synthase [Biscogniauxia marginata]